jgi:hypothetical protein
MRRFRNHSDFREEIAKIRKSFEDKNSQVLERLQDSLSDAEPRPGASRRMAGELLEAHARTYLIDGFLYALNWNVNFSSEPLSLAPELPVKVTQDSETKFLDYFGFDRETTAPMLIVEAKRPNATLPRGAATAQYDQNARLRKIVANGLSGREISGPWPRWFDQLRTYCRALEGAGLRSVCITNGNWLIIFADPRDAFFTDGPVDQDRIYIYENFGEKYRRSDEIFRLLEYYSLAQKLPEIVPGDLPSLLAGCGSARAMHAIQVDYNETSHGYGRQPVVFITPLLFLKAEVGCWLRVGRGGIEPFLLPDGRDSPKLGEHLEDVTRAATSLLTEVAHQLRFQPDLVDLTKHDPELEGLAYTASCPTGSQTHHQIIVLTGRCTHFFKRRPSVSDCPLHWWAQGKLSGCHVGDVPLHQSSVEQRGFFSDGLDHHCAHRDVLAAKNPHAPGMLQPIGAPTGPFCKIWGFERRLCCRTCVFEEVCEAAPTFNLPCRRP